MNRLTPAEMANALGISTKTFLRDVSRKQIPHLVAGSRKRFEPVEVAIFLGMASSLQDRPRRPEEPPRPPILQTYLIWAEGTRFYKIGSSRNPNDRLCELATGSPHNLILLATISYEIVAEPDLHVRFAHCRHRGEWFAFAHKKEILPAFGVYS